MLADSATLKLDNQKNGWKGVASSSMQMGKNSCAEFLPLGVATVTSVRFQAAIGKYGYPHIGTTGKVTATSLMRTTNEI